MTVALPDLLAERFPPLATYCPNLPTISSPQALFLMLDCLEGFYGGAAGGGKSDALLMAALQYVDVPGYAALLLRRTYAELEKADGLIPRADEWLSNTDARRIDGGKKWVFPSGARLEFGHVKDEADKHSFQSAAYQFIGFDEATSFSLSQYEYIGFSRSRRRMFGKVSKVPIRVRSASNPGNVGHLWVRERFVDPKTRKPGVVFIPARVQDNPGLDVVEYRATMANLSEELQAQLLEGDWDAFADQAFPGFGEPHLVRSFPLEGSAFNRIEAMDYGLNGCAWLLIATDYEGNTVFVDSLSVKDKLPDEVAPLIVANRKAGWGFSHSAYADPSLWHRIGARNKWGAPAMLADEFTDAGVTIVPATNDPRAGFIRLRTMMKADPEHRFPEWHPRRGEKGAPRMFVVGSACPELVDQLRAAPLQPIDKPDGGEKVDPIWESRHGHFVAASRYGSLAHLVASVEPEPEVTDERALRLIEALERDEDPARMVRARYEFC